MSTRQNCFIGVSAAIMMLVGAGVPAHAVGTFGPIIWITASASYVTTTTTFPSPPPPGKTTTVTTRTLVITLDPPSFSNIDLTIDYDPSLFQFLGGGTLCAFGTGGDCPAVDTTRGVISPIPSISSLTLGTALPGGVLSVTGGGGSVNLAYDLSGASSAPVSGSPDESFFGLVFTPLVPLQDTVTNQDTPGAYDITLASVSCTLSDMTSCRTDSPSYGFSFTRAPEPSALALIATGLAGLLGYRHWQRKKGRT